MENGDKQQLLLDLFRAYFDARQNKRNTANALAFEDGYMSVCQPKLIVITKPII
jgi:hypothetical protein